MDDLEYLVQETFRLNQMLQEGEDRPFKYERGNVPQGPGILYHLQNSGAVFVVRTFVSQDIAKDYSAALEHPEEYPSLKLLADGGAPRERLQWFSTETLDQAEHVHGRMGQRRFPRREEDVCNLSDPGFSWWLESHGASFTVYGKMNWVREGLTRLGPVHDVNLAGARWSELATALTALALPVNVTNEVSRFQLSAAEEHAWLIEEFRRVFTVGEVSDELRDMFVILGKRGAQPAHLESCWYFLQEVATARKFWLQIQTQLS